MGLWTVREHVNKKQALLPLFSSLEFVELRDYKVEVEVCQEPISLTGVSGSHLRQ